AAFNLLGIGHQQFIRTDCSAQTDLRFKFGFGTLPKSESLAIDNPRSHVGLTVRTNYDEVMLRGRGFIYLASDIGPNSYYGGKGYIEKPWQHEALMYLTLVHELGHVFGLPHVGASYSLMSAQFVEMILNRQTAEVLKTWKITTAAALPFFFFPANYFVHCDIKGFPSAASYFGLDAVSKCLHFVIDGDNGFISVYTSRQPGYPEKLEGRIDRLDFMAETAYGIMVFMTNKQKVFAVQPDPFQLLTGPFFLAKKGSAQFTRSSGGASKPLHMDMSPLNFTIVGLVGTDLKTILNGPMNLIPHF
ncbi:MAG: hypothetical protein ABL958_15095, partial [Bdellovibrionia bacterium]